MPRHKIPTAIKALNGNPGKRKSDLTGGILVKRSMPPTPAHLSDAAKAVFEDTAKLLYDLGVLCVADAAALEMYACNIVLLRQAHLDVARDGYYLRTPLGKVYANPALKIIRDFEALAQRFHIEMGLTAAARSRINIAPPSDPETDEFTAKYLT